MPEAQVDVQSWHKLLNDHKVYDCGWCQDCKTRLQNVTISPPVANISRLSRLTMIGVELNKANIELVKALTDSIKKSSSLWNDVVIHTKHAAASNIHGEIFVQRCKAGLEKCKMISKNITNLMGTNFLRKHYDRIPEITIDSLVEELVSDKILKSTKQTIDILLIDTEGSDALVLEGAKGILSTGSVRMLVFEYHYNCPWANTTLGSVIENLSNLSYDCYFEGQKRVWKLTGCWDSLWEIRRWSNVLCLHRGDIWHHIIEQSYVVTRETAYSELMKLNPEQRIHQPCKNPNFPCLHQSNFMSS